MRGKKFSTIEYLLFPILIIGIWIFQYLLPLWFVFIPVEDRHQVINYFIKSDASAIKAFVIGTFFIMMLLAGYMFAVWKLPSCKFTRLKAIEPTGSIMVIAWGSVAVGLMSLLFFVEINHGIIKALVFGRFRHAKIIGGSGWLFHLSWLMLAGFAMISEMNFYKKKILLWFFLFAILLIFSFVSVLGGRLKASFFIIIPFFVWMVLNARGISIKAMVCATCALAIFIYSWAWAIAGFRAGLLVSVDSEMGFSGIDPVTTSTGAGFLEYFHTLLFVELNKLLVLGSAIGLDEEGVLHGATFFYLIFPFSLLFDFDGQIPGNYVARMVIPGNYGFWGGLPGDLYLNVGLWGGLFSILFGAVAGFFRFVFLKKLRIPSLWVVFMCASCVLVGFGLNRWPEWVMISSFLAALRYCTISVGGRKGA